MDKFLDIRGLLKLNQDVVTQSSLIIKILIIIIIRKSQPTKTVQKTDPLMSSDKP